MAAIKTPYDLRDPTPEEVARVRAELEQKRRDHAAWQADWDRKHPKRPARTGPPERRIGATDTRTEEEKQQERRLGPTSRRTPGSDRRNAKRNTTK